MRLAGVDLHDLVPHLVGHQAETRVRTLGLPYPAAAALVAKERGFGKGDPRRGELAHQIQAEASARILLWDVAGRRDLQPDTYREARQRLHGRDLLAFQPGPSGGEPVVILDGVERSLREAVAGALEPRRPMIAVPEGYKRPSRGTLVTARTLAAAEAQERLLDGPAQAPSRSQEPSAPAVPTSPQPEPRIRHRKP